MNDGAMFAKDGSVIQTHDPLCDQPDAAGQCYVCDFIYKIRADERQRISRMAKVRLARNAQDTSIEAARKAVLKSGTRRKEIFDLIAEREFGLTDDEIEVLTGLTHQSASGLRNSLMRDGLIVDSGERRKNRRGNSSIVWKANT
jgi:hypothetical protein